MNLRLHSRAPWPFLLTMVVFFAITLIVLPAVIDAAYETAAQTGQSVELKQVYITAILLASAGLIAGSAVTMYYTDRHLSALNRLTKAAVALGEGDYQEIVIPEERGMLRELEELSEALRKTARQTENQFSALSKERTMLSAVLDHMTDGVLIADYSGKVQLLNPAAEKLFTISEQDALGRAVVEVMRHHGLVELWEETRQGTTKTIYIEMGGAHKYLQVSGISFGESLPGRSMMLLQDLTKTHQLETIRRDFISNVSHELRTPMAGLKAISETLLDGALDDPPAARRFVVRMDSEVNNLVQMVNELLELSRIESGRSNFEFEAVTPQALISKPLERMRLQAELVDVSISEHCPPGLPAVLADPNQISQVFVNLIHNAIKFTPNGGHIEVSAAQQGGEVVFKVEDNGVGIASKELSRIFERFYKADRSRAGGGTGLGLSICRHIIEGHGGRIWAESEEGAGSQFFFTLPILPNDLD